MPQHGKLGKQPPKHDPRTLRLARYIDEATWTGIKIPTKVLETPAVPTWPMFKNDTYGDCVEAAMGHVAELLSKLGRGSEVTVTDADVLKVYSDVAGFDPKNPNATDNGTIVLDALNYWRKTGIAGHKILGYASFNPRNHTEWKAANALFGATVVGIALPATAQQQSTPQDTWSVVTTRGDGAPDSWGGHCVPGFDFDYRKVDVVTWGYVQKATWGFIGTYCVAPDVRILTDDLQWVDAADLVAGDGLMAFDEEAQHPRGDAGGHSRRWRRGVVESSRVIERPCFDLAFDDGTTVRCSSDHQWLTHSNQGAHWLRTDRLRVGRGLGSNVVKPVDVWRTEKSRDAGYLAAAFDGEGCFTQRDLSETVGVAATRLSFAQKDNIMLEQVARALKEHGFTFNETMNSSGNDVHVLNLSRRKEVLRFLGAIRPERLLEKFRPELMGQVSMKTVKLAEKVDVGMQPVVAMKTSTGTYLAEGMASHNCDEAYAIFDENWVDAVTQKAPNGFNHDQLLQDLSAFS